MEALPKMAMRLPGNCLTSRTSDAMSPFSTLKRWPRNLMSPLGAAKIAVESDMVKDD
jgi:hypothetical protein